MMYQRERAHSSGVRLGAAVFMLSACLFASNAHAEESAQVEARKHFLQGVALVDQQRLAEALTEFEQCYALYPAFGTLYNIAQVHAALGHSVAAVETFEKYLAEGDSSIPAKQRARAEAELAAQRQRIGELTVQVTPADAQLLIDDNVVARSGAAITVRLAAGPHQVSAVLVGHRTEQRPVDIVAQNQVNLTLTLEPLPPANAPVLPPSTPPAPSPTEPLPSSSSKQKIIGLAVGGAGLVGAGVGLGIALAGQAKHRDALDQWAAGDKASARETESASSRQKTAGYVVIGVGGAMALAGAIVAFTARPTASSSASAATAKARSDFSWSPWISTSLLGASLQQRW